VHAYTFNIAITQDLFKEYVPDGGGGGGAPTKRDHTILSVEKWQMVVGDKKFGDERRIWGILIQNMFVFSTPRTAFRAFSETDFWIYSVQYIIL
jgi:hypothetical protein